MKYLSYSEISDQLRTIMIECIMSDNVARACLYCRKRCPEIGESVESLIDQYEFHLKAFVEIAAGMLDDREKFNKLVTICDPWVVFSFNNALHLAINNLKNMPKGKIRCAESMGNFFKRFALYGVY